MVPIVYAIWSNRSFGAIEWNRARLANVPQHVVCLGACNVSKAFSIDYRLKRYYHHSINPPSYERRCFERFGALLMFMNQHNFTKVMHVDADIFVQSHAFYRQMIRHNLSLVAKPYPQSAVTDASTYLLVVTREILDRFVRYMQDVFRSAQRVQSTAMTFGTRVKECCPYYKGSLTMHLSDMQLFMAFMKVHRIVPTFYAPFLTSEHVDCRRISCRSEPAIHFQGQGACKRKISEYAQLCPP